MAKVTIYTKMYCGFCDAARQLLEQKQVSFEEIPVDGDRVKQASMRDRANGRITVPQIFINNAHIGGCDDLYALERDGKLDSLLASG
jgi:glutaredoxin 3